MDDFYPSLNGVIMVMDNQTRLLMSTYDAEVTVIVPQIEKNYQDDFPYKVIRIPSVRINKIGYDMAMPSLDLATEKKILESEFDIIHIHSPFIIGEFGIKIAQKLKIPCVATMHTQFDMDIKKFTKSNLITKIVMVKLIRNFNKCDACYAVNKKVATLYKKHGVKKLPSVIPTGTDMKLVLNQEIACEIVNKQYNIQKDELVLLFVGRLTIVKNILFLVDVLKILKKQNIKFKMLFVGPHEDQSEFEDKIKESKLEDDIILTGKITDRAMLANIYCRSKLFLFPSLYDTSSLVQKEAASQKTPTVFIKGAVTADDIINNVTGFLAPNDINQYAAKVKEILEDEKLYEKVSENCYEHIYVSWEKIIDILYYNYVKIIDETKVTVK